MIKCRSLSTHILGNLYAAMDHRAERELRLLHGDRSFVNARICLSSNQHCQALSTGDDTTVGICCHIAGFVVFAK